MAWWGTAWQRGEAASWGGGTWSAGGGWSRGGWGEGWARGRWGEGASEAPQESVVPGGAFLYSPWPVSITGYPAQGAAHSWGSLVVSAHGMGCTLTLKGRYGANLRLGRWPRLVIKGNSVRELFAIVRAESLAAGIDLSRITQPHFSEEDPAQPGQPEEAAPEVPDLVLRPGPEAPAAPEDPDWGDGESSRGSECGQEEETAWEEASPAAPAGPAGWEAIIAAAREAMERSWADESLRTEVTLAVSQLSDAPMYRRGDSVPAAGRGDGVPALMACTACFRREDQLKEALPINVLHAARFREVVHFVVMLFDSEEAQQTIPWLLRTFALPIAEGWLHVCLARGMEHWECSAAKNTAHVAGWRLRPEWASEERTLLLNLDADNVVSSTFFRRLLEQARRNLRYVVFQHSGQDGGCTGRLTLSAWDFAAINGSFPCVCISSPLPHLHHHQET